MSRKNNNQLVLSKEQYMPLFIALVAIIMMFMPSLGWSAAGDVGTACTEVQKFLDGAKNILTAISVGVVTIAVMIAGYQIAFAHKRLGDVLPILVGGILIGSAAQIASWLAPSGGC